MSERDAIADEIECAMKGLSLLSGDDLRKATHAFGKLTYAHSSKIIAALRARDREDGAREPFIQEHRADTLRYMLERAERMSRCLYRAGETADAARYREEADALTWVLGTLSLSARKEPSDAV